MSFDYFGFHGYYQSRGEPGTFWDLVYLSLQLFTLESGSVTGELSWPLQVARLLAYLDLRDFVFRDVAAVSNCLRRPKAAAGRA